MFYRKFHTQSPILPICPITPPSTGHTSHIVHAFNVERQFEAHFSRFYAESVRCVTLALNRPKPAPFPPKTVTKLKGVAKKQLNFSTSHYPTSQSNRKFTTKHPLQPIVTYTLPPLLLFKREQLCNSEKCAKTPFVADCTVCLTAVHICAETVTQQ